MRVFHQNESCISCLHPHSSYERRREQVRQLSFWWINSQFDRTLRYDLMQPSVLAHPLTKCVNVNTVPVYTTELRKYATPVTHTCVKSHRVPQSSRDSLASVFVWSCGVFPRCLPFQKKLQQYWQENTAKMALANGGFVTVFSKGSNKPTSTEDFVDLTALGIATVSDKVRREQKHEVNIFP